MCSASYRCKCLRTAGPQAWQARRCQCQDKTQAGEGCAPFQPSDGQGTHAACVCPREHARARPPCQRHSVCWGKTEGGRPALKSGQNAVIVGRLQRHNEAKQARERKRSESLQQRRREGPPTVVALLPLSAEVDAERLWHLLLSAFESRPGAGAGARKTRKGDPEQMEEDTQGGSRALAALIVPL